MLSVAFADRMTVVPLRVWPLEGDVKFTVGGVASPPPEEATYSKRLGDPVPALVTLLGVALLFNDVATASGVAVGLAAKYSAAAPATCGVAMDVPLMVLVAVGLLYQSDLIEEPGAKISRHDP
jgi:hypothetical protein